MNNPGFVDSHCHLEFEDFSPDTEQVVARGREEGVCLFLSIGTRPENMPSLLDLTKNYHDIYATVGVHPCHAHSIDEKDLEALLTHYTSQKKIVGLGETGLDCYYGKEFLQKQEKSFQCHIRVACQTDLPLVVHTRSAEKETVRCLKEAKECKGVIHCFTGTKWLAQQALDLGFYISISGIVTFKNAQDLRDILKYVPSSRILIETDAPYLAPVPFRGKRNEPSFIRHTAQAVASLYNLSVEQVASITRENFFRLFTKTAPLKPPLHHPFGLS